MRFDNEIYPTGPIVSLLKANLSLLVHIQHTVLAYACMHAHTHTHTRNDHKGMYTLTAFACMLIIHSYIYAHDMLRKPLYQFDYHIGCQVCP